MVAQAIHLSGLVTLPITQIRLLCAFTVLVNIPYYFFLDMTTKSVQLATVFCVIDTIVITWIIHLTGGANSAILLGYPLLIIYAGIRLAKTSSYVIALSSMVFYSLMRYVESAYPSYAPSVQDFFSTGYTIATIIGGYLLLFLSAWFSASFSEKLKRKNIELETAQRDLELRTTQLVQSEKAAAVGRLAVALAHEINKPNFIIKNLAEILKEEMTEKGAVQDSILAILRQSRKIEETVTGLVSYAKPAIIERRWVDIHTLLHETVETMKKIASPLIHFVESLSPSLPEVYADGKQLEQVFSNLIINAIQSIHGEGSITIATEEIPFKKYARDSQSPQSDSSQGRGVQVTVSDTGEGIPSEKVSRIFEPYFTTKEIGKGVGLGLAICYEIVSAHGGVIEVESEWGKGSTFRIMVPLGEGGHRGL